MGAAKQCTQPRATSCSVLVKALSKQDQTKLCRPLPARFKEHQFELIKDIGPLLQDYDWHGQEYYDQNEAVRELRSRQHQEPVPTTWLDRDDSGNYAPDDKKQRLRNTAKNIAAARARVAKRGQASTKAQDKSETDERASKRACLQVGLGIPKVSAVAADTITTIVTCWVHPMRFMQSKSTDCTWCVMPVVAALGLPKRCVKVLAYRSEGPYPITEYAELSNGYRAQGERETRMCEKCTRLRKNIVTCQHGALQRIEPQTGLASIEASLERLSPDQPAEALRAEMRKWCFICPRPATYQCCKRQPKAGRGALHPENVEDEGCGLRVCGTCRRFLSGEVHGEPGFGVQELLARMPTPPAGAYKYGYRADFELLSIDGPLMGVLGLSK